MPDRTAKALQSIAANVRRIRTAKNVTQEQLAEATDLHLTYVQAIERGTRNISVGVLLALADALDVPVSRLLRDAKLEPPKRGRPRKRRVRRRREP